MFHKVIEPLVKLERNYDGYFGEPPTELAMLSASRVMRLIYPQQDTPYSFEIYPDRCGGILMFWGDEDLVFEIDSFGELQVTLYEY